MEAVSLCEVYVYVGDGAYVIGIPARDLTAEDLARMLEREGRTEAEVLASGLYERAACDESVEEDEDGNQGV